MRSAVAPESRRAQVSASLIITSATVSVPIICARGLAFSNQGGTASCFFLVGRSVGDRFGWTLGRGKAWALCAHTSSVPPTPISFLSFNLRGQLLANHLHPHGLGHVFHSGGLSALAGLYRSLGGI